MIFDFNPWQLDVDIDLTKQLYKEVDYSTDKTANMEFIESFTRKYGGVVIAGVVGAIIITQQ